MKFRRPTKFQTFLLICLGVFVVHRAFFRAPSEAEMVAQFHQHKTEFEQIRLMLQQDKDIKYIGHSQITNDDGSILGLSKKRSDVYISRLKNLGLSTISSRDGNIWFYQFGGGFTDTTWSIGYLYSEKPPTPLVESAYSKMPGRGKRHYSLIEGNWYIYHRR